MPEVFLENLKMKIFGGGVYLYDDTLWGIQLFIKQGSYSAMKIIIFLVFLSAAVCLSHVKDQPKDALHEHQHHIRSQAMEHEQLATAIVVGEVVASLFGIPTDNKLNMLTSIIKKGAQILKIDPTEWNILSWTSRSLQLTFDNLSNQRIEFVEDFLSPGEWKKTWTFPIQPLTLSQALVGNEGSWGGVKGSLKLKLQNEDTYLYLGFSNPWIKLGGLWDDTSFYVQMTTQDYDSDYGEQKCKDNRPMRSKFYKYTLSVQQYQSSYAKSDFFYKLEEKGVTKETATRVLSKRR